MTRVIPLILACSCCYGQWSILGNPPSGRNFELHDTSKAFGPGSIGVSSRSLVPGNPNGLWHTENLGATPWTMLSNQQVSSWVLNCSNEIVYTQLGAGLPITRLMGNTSAHNSTQTGDFRRIGINHSTCRIYALDVNGSVFVSTDSGATFSAMSPQTHFNHANAIGPMAIRPSDGAIFVCDEVEPCEMFNGTSWQNVGVANNANNVFFTPDGGAWACDSNNYPRKWDGASSWNTVTVTSSFVFRCHGAVNVGTDTYISGRSYSGGEGPYVFKSSNNGASWSPFITGLKVVSGGESETIEIGCDGRLYVATDDEDFPSTTLGVFSYAGVGPATCANSPPPPQPLQISGSLAGGSIGSGYSQKLSATGGTPPYNWTVASGSLPPGLILNSAAGTVTGTPTGAGTFSFTMQVGDSTGSTPASQQFSVIITGGGTILISGSAIVNAASYAAGSVSPGEMIVIFGSGFGPRTLANLQLDGRGYVGSALGGTQVLFDGVAAPMIYAEAGQVSVVVPYAVSGAAATQVQVVYQGQSSNMVSIPVSTIMPGAFTSDSSGQGQGAIINQDGTANSRTNPAPAGSYVSVFATGEGQSIPGGVDGKPASAPAPVPLAQPVSAFVGGLLAQVQYAGGAPGLVAGVWQVNLQIPQGLPPGSAPLQLTIGSRATQTGVTIAVR